MRTYPNVLIEMALADPGVAHQILWLRLVRPLIGLFKLDPRFTVMFSDLTGSCRQCCCTPCPAVPREGTLLPPGFLSTSNPTFAKWSLFGCPFPSTAWVFSHQSASSACSHAQASFPRAVAHQGQSPRPAPAQFLTHSRRVTWRVAPACCAPRAWVRHMARTVLPQEISPGLALPSPPPSSTHWSFLFLRRLAKNTPDRNPASLQQTQKIKLLSTEQGSGGRGQIGVLPGASGSIGSHAGGWPHFWIPCAMPSCT